MRRLLVLLAVLAVLVQSWNPCLPDDARHAGSQSDVTLTAQPASPLVDVGPRRTSPLEQLLGREAGCSLCTSIELASLVSRAPQAPHFGGHPTASRSLQSQQVRWQI